mmetsp:Transcript_11185/g.16423  ORF Transcript_11185/g.16423 Transcript_11185/m.16423 type:complete len:103 (-) Transcript_11185:7-315(-)
MLLRSVVVVVVAGRRCRRRRRYFLDSSSSLPVLNEWHPKLLVVGTTWEEQLYYSWACILSFAMLLFIFMGEGEARETGSYVTRLFAGVVFFFFDTTASTLCS